jgi:N-acetylneuraminic acid mutarotase
MLLIPSVRGLLSQRAPGASLGDPPARAESAAMARHLAGLRILAVAATALALAACGGSNSSTASYTIGGTISGLTVSDVVLTVANQTVKVSAGAATWVFANKVASGTAYTVSIATEPSGEVCEITSGASGTLTANVDNVTVACSSNATWTWETGSSAVNTEGAFGPQGTPSTGSTPGARYGSSSWLDSSGNLWLFGGYGYDSVGSLGSLNDLWQYTPSTGLWTWVSGSEARNAGAVYGTEGTAAGSNVPGARQSGSSWIDASGNLWLFGGYGYDSTGTLGNLNDLWKYSSSTRQWTWVDGSNVRGAMGVYGTQGTGSSSNLPGARYGSVSWVDSSGNLWLFGGYGYDSSGGVGDLNDLWKYSPSSGQWTWVSGAQVRGATGVYGTQGTSSSNIAPGARQTASGWIDSSGDLYLFGGYGYDASGTVGNLNDLWKCNPSTGDWTWVSGSNQRGASGAYGALGVAASTNVPGAREGASAWTDSSGNLWLFGGGGGVSGEYNDLWLFSPGSGDWTWVGGADQTNTSGSYGSQGVASASNAPGSRQSASAWIDASGDLWLFGGIGYGASGNGYLNDLWEYIAP